MRDTGRYRLPEALSGFLRSSGARVSFRREIDYGTQYGVSDRNETVTLNVFSTGKVVVQGKRGAVLKERIDAWLRGAAETRGSGRPSSVEAVPDSTPRVGTDEAGKGEYFGPLVVAGVRVLGAGQSHALHQLGVRDSKTVANVRATTLSAEILRVAGARNVRELALPPRQYEERRRAAGSVQRLLGELHAEILRELAEGAEVAVVDSLGTGSGLECHAPPGLRLVMRPRAEDDVAVAAASVVARARYLAEMSRLSGAVGFELPRGSTHVREAVSRVYRERGMEGLEEVAKVHFSITRQVLGRARGDGR